MSGCKLYERLIKEHPDYCKRKMTKTLKAACEYLEGGVTLYQMYLKYKVDPSLLSKKCKQIRRLLKLDIRGA